MVAPLVNRRCSVVADAPAVSYSISKQPLDHLLATHQNSTPRETKKYLVERRTIASTQETNVLLLVGKTL